jgi:hypothetical protein
MLLISTHFRINFLFMRRVINKKAIYEEGLKGPKSKTTEGGTYVCTEYLAISTEGF